MTPTSSLNVATRFVASGVVRLAIWYAAIYPLVVGGIAYGLYLGGETGDEHLWRNLTVAPAYYLVAVGIIATVSMLPMLVAHGLTRATFAHAAIRVFAALAVILGLYVVVLIALDATLAGSLPWGRTLTNEVSLDAFGTVIRVFASVVLTGLAALASGWLAGLVWQTQLSRGRFGWQMATLLMVPCAIPLFAAETVQGTGAFGAGIAEDLGLALGPWGGSILALVIAAASLALCVRFTRFAVVGARSALA